MTDDHPLCLVCTRRLRASVLLLHGYAAAAEVHLGDAATFVDEYTEVLLPDAPGHGRRADGRLERIAALPDDARRVAILELAGEWAGELPRLAAQCRARGAERVGVLGISMGGFAALGALGSADAARDFDAVAAVLAAPTLLDGVQLPAELPPLLLGLAGRDAAVPAAPGRAFAHEHGAELYEYPESAHFMRAEDWRDLWGRVAAFLRRHLTPA